MEEPKTYKKGNFRLILEDAKSYRKKVLTKAVKISGDFYVETSEGNMYCKDGYLAVDSRGYPYPIATEEFEQIYDEVKEGGMKNE